MIVVEIGKDLYNNFFWILFMNEFTIKEVYKMRLVMKYEIDYDGWFYFLAPISKTWQLIFVPDIKLYAKLFSNRRFKIK